jgi:hypothetical protein
MDNRGPLFLHVFLDAAQTVTEEGPECPMSTGCCPNSDADNVQGTPRGTSFLRQVNPHLARQWKMVSNLTDQAHANVGYKLRSLLSIRQDRMWNMVPLRDLSAHISDLTSKRMSPWG